MTPNPSITRRQAIGAGATGVAFLFAGRAGASFDLGGSVAEAASATCVMTPAKTEGPYFVDEKLDRSDIRADTGTGAVQAGTPLALTMYVFDASGDCAPVQGAQVDVWHANAAGQYSDVSQNGTVGVDWLRGYQVTDSDGKVTFKTIWPGWYQGRAVHIHFKVRTSGGLEFTSQLFFTDAMNSTVYQSAPYASRGDASLKDSADNIYGTDGSSLLLNPTSDGAGGYVADFSVGVSGGGSDTGSGSGSGTDTTAADTSVAATVTSVKAVRLANGARQARVRLRPEEPVTARVKVTRSGHTLAHRKVALAAGSHTLRLTLGRAVKAGGARVTIRLTDTASNTRTYTRTIHVPKRRKTG